MKEKSENTFAYWLFWTILIVMVLLLPGFVWHENTSGFLTDDGMYLLLADFFSPFYDRNPLVDRLVIDQSRFPPAFPVLIGLFGGGSENMRVAHLVTCATFIASGVCFYAWARRMLGSREIAAACLLIYALMPRTLVYVLEIWSEFLYMALAFAVLILMDVYERSERHAHHTLLVCSLFVGLTLLTRTIGVALLAVFLLFLYTNSVKRKLYYILIALSLPVFWEIVKMTNGYPGNYGGDLKQYTTRTGALTLIFTDIPHNAHLLFQSWNKHFSIYPGSPWFLHALCVLLLSLAFIGAGRQALKKRPDFYYLTFYVSIVLVWPYPSHNLRFLYPLIPLALAYVFVGVSVVTWFLNPRTRSLISAGLVLVMLAMIVPNAVNLIERFFTPIPKHILPDYRHTRLWLNGRDLDLAYRQTEQIDVVIRLISRIDRYLAPYECVYAVHPVSVILYSNRRALQLPEQASVKKLRLCDYLFVMNLVGKFHANYPLREIDMAKLALLDMEMDNRGHPQAFLFKIRR